MYPNFDIALLSQVKKKKKNSLLKDYVKEINN